MSAWIEHHGGPRPGFLPGAKVIVRFRDHSHSPSHVPTDADNEQWEHRYGVNPASDIVAYQVVEDGRKAALDPVNRPLHYTSHPSGIECIQITEHMGFVLGNVVKYVWRADLKGGVEDLKKAEFYIKREIERREKQA